LQDIEIVDQVDGEDRALQLIPKTPEQKGLPVKLIAKSVEQKQEWSEALNVTAVPHAIEDLGDEEPVLVIQEPQKTVETEQKIKRSTTQPKHEAEPERKAAKLDEEKPNLKKQTETDAKVEILEDFDAYEEINTVMTESLHSGSITSLDASEMEPSQTKPQFKKSLRGVVCGQGESAVFECEVKSQSSPTIKWLKNNQPINPTNRLETMSLGSKYSLIIKDTTQNDAGLYTVMVTNSQGVSSCSAPLNVRPEDKVLFQGLEDELLGSKTPSPEPGKQPAFKW
ncbi:myosin light chain kinase, smooth muscle-like, partial [Limulus polyphemus]|uniref:Myosin light chain kinase, smooth muscle-like n=1 Tax=Limulus polyphemus TaxID=6850 RepID=A0ABM1TP99_LIMPO